MRRFATSATARTCSPSASGPRCSRSDGSARCSRRSRCRTSASSRRRSDGPTQYLDAGEQRELRNGRGLEGVREGTYYAARPVAQKALVLLRPKRLDAATSRPFLGGLIVAGVFGLLLAAGAAVLLARALARPLGRLADASQRLAEGEHRPVPVEGPTELASLATSFNEMAAKLERARAAERSFLLSVTHELRTPLTAIRGYAEALDEGVVDPQEAGETIAAEAGRLERLVQDVLELARLNRIEFDVEREPIDLGAVARDAIRRYEPQARAFGVELVLDMNGGAPASATRSGRSRSSRTSSRTHCA